jgi:hypothetical protein
MQLANSREVPAQFISSHLGQNGDAIFRSLAASDDDLAGVQVDVFHSESKCFEDAEAGSIEQDGDEAPGRREAADDRSHFVPTQEDRKADRPRCSDDALQPWHLAAENGAIEEQQRGERLILGRSRQVLFDCEMAEEGGHFSLAQFGGVPSSMVLDEADGPLDVRSFCPPAVMARSDSVTNSVEELRLALACLLDCIREEWARRS